MIVVLSSVKQIDNENLSSQMSMTMNGGMGVNSTKT